MIIGKGAQGSTMLIEFQPNDDPASELTLRVKEQRLIDMMRQPLSTFPIAASVTTANDLVINISCRLPEQNYFTSIPHKPVF